MTGRMGQEERSGDPPPDGEDRGSKSPATRVRCRVGPPAAHPRSSRSVRPAVLGLRLARWRRRRRCGSPRSARGATLRRRPAVVLPVGIRRPTRWQHPDPPRHASPPCYKPEDDGRPSSEPADIDPSPTGCPDDGDLSTAQIRSRCRKSPLPWKNRHCGIKPGRATPAPREVDAGWCPRSRRAARSCSGPCCIRRGPTRCP